MGDAIKGFLAQLEAVEEDWPDEPTLTDADRHRLALRAEVEGLPSAAACLVSHRQWPDHRGWFSVPHDFDERCDEIANLHGLALTTEAHRTLLYQLRLLANVMWPVVQTKEKSVRTSKGATSWRTTLRRMDGWHSKITAQDPDFLYVLALELHTDETAFVASEVAKVRKNLTHLVIALESAVAFDAPHDTSSHVDELRFILSRLQTIAGGRGGRHPYDEHLRECGALAKQFWCDHRGEKPVARFVLTKTTEPDNHFSRWFCDVMRYVANLDNPSSRELIR